MEEEKKIENETPTSVTKKRTPTIPEIALIYKNNYGNISATCEALSISRLSWYRRLEKNPKFNQAMKEVDEGLIDFAESQLSKNIKAGKEVSLIFFLKNKAPDIWKDKQEMKIDGKMYLVDADK